ncbi:putative protein ARB2BP [Delphinus delphis]|uniref:putative protein ARB2BP n=1 Tax=Delphinus delphis TaxID=9728 RepID=UPI0028C4FE82|nr:putative protein FAM172B [Delphinus delphis]
MRPKEGARGRRTKMKRGDGVKSGRGFDDSSEWVFDSQGPARPGNPPLCAPLHPTPFHSPLPSPPPLPAAPEPEPEPEPEPSQLRAAAPVVACSPALPEWLPVTQELSFRKFIEQSDLLEELKYDFNEKAELRHTETHKPFVFNYYKNVLERNSKRYQALGHLLEQYIYELLEKVCKLQKVYIPPEADKEPRSFFFMSERALTGHHSALLVLLQDRGVFRAGQWSQQAVIHHGLQHGSQIPCIQMALQAHYDVIVLNPNDNFVDLQTEKEWKGLLTQNVESPSRKMVQTECFLSLQQSLQCIPKRCSNTPEEHMAYIWDYFISKAEGKDVAFLVHGYGGLVFMDLLVRRKWEVMSKVYAVALIDSEHHVGHQLGSDIQLLAWIKHHCREWVTSPKPLDKPAATVLKKEFPTVSAGTEEHNLAPSSSLQSIFKYFRKSLKAKAAINFSRVPIVTRSSTKRKQSA